MSTQHSRSRRDFLSKLTAAVGGGVAMATSSGLVQASPQVSHESSEDKPVKAHKGYQHTEHVDTYYRLADF
ncbi:MAG: hypothetical protein Kow0083_01260 [Methylophaga sp.]|jgi:hypothetical protein